MLSLGLQSVPCISLPGFSSCETTGNLYSFFNAITCIELDRRICDSNINSVEKKNK